MVHSRKKRQRENHKSTHFRVLILFNVVSQTPVPLYRVPFCNVVFILQIFLNSNFFTSGPLVYSCTDSQDTDSTHLGRDRLHIFGHFNGRQETGLWVTRTRQRQQSHWRGSSCFTEENERLF